MARFLARVLIVGAFAGTAWHFRNDIEAWIRTLTASGPALTSIAEIVASPQRFDGREVTVAGTVSGTSEVSYAGRPPSRSYTLREGKVEIVVDTPSALPARGQTLTVTGKAARPAGQGLAPRLAEAKRASAK